MRTHRRLKFDFLAVVSLEQRRAGCLFNGRPVLLEKIVGVVIVERIYSNAAGSPAGSVRNLEMENEADWLVMFILVIAAHFSIPPGLRRTGRS